MCATPARHVSQVQATATPVEAESKGEQKKLWGGRFTGATDPLMEKFNESLPFDKRMWAEDIRVRRTGQATALHRTACQMGTRQGCWFLSYV